MNILKPENIRLSANAKTKQEAIAQAGQILVEQGYVEESYIPLMYEREKLTSTYMGNLLAIPHGTDDAKEEVIASGLVILTVDQPIDWDGNEVRLVIGIAGKGNEHLDLLGKIALVCAEQDNVERLLQVKSEEDVIRFFAEVSE